MNPKIAITLLIIAVAKAAAFGEAAGSSKREAIVPELVTTNLWLDKPRIGHREKFEFVDGISFGGNDSFFFADDCCIRRLDSQGNVEEFAGKAREPGEKLGFRKQARFGSITCTYVDNHGVVYFGDGNAVRRIDKQGIVTTLVTLEAPAKNSVLPAKPEAVSCLAGDATGAVYVSDPIFRRLFKIGHDGSATVITTLRDLPDKVSFQGPICVDKSGGIIAGLDWGVYRISPDGTCAPAYSEKYNEEYYDQVRIGSERFNAMCLDGDGNLFVSDGWKISVTRPGGEYIILADYSIRSLCCNERGDLYFDFGNTISKVPHEKLMKFMDDYSAKHRKKRKGKAE